MIIPYDRINNLSISVAIIAPVMMRLAVLLQVSNDASPGSQTNPGNCQTVFP